MAWTRKSSWPHLSRNVANTASTLAMSSTSQGSTSVDAERLRQRLDPLAQRLALIGEGQLGALRRQRLGNAPGNRMIIGDAHDQPALALHQVLHCSRALSLFVMPGACPG